VSRYCLPCVLLFVLNVSKPGCADEIAHCGVAAIYGAARILDVETSPDAIERLIRLRYGQTDLSRLSLRQLRHAAEDLGLSAQSLSAEPARFHEIPTPAILHFRPERVARADGEVGHAVLLTHVDIESACILDLTQSSGPVIIPLAELREVWDGEFLSISKMTNAWSFPTIPPWAWLCLAAFAAFGFWRCYLRRLGQPPKEGGAAGDLADRHNWARDS